MRVRVESRAYLRLILSGHPDHVDDSGKVRY